MKKKGPEKERSYDSNPNPIEWDNEVGPLLCEIESRLDELASRLHDAPWARVDETTQRCRPGTHHTNKVDSFAGDMESTDKNELDGLITELKRLVGEAVTANRVSEQRHHDVTDLLGGCSKEMRIKLVQGISIIDRVPLGKLFPHWKEDITEGLDVSRDVLPALENLHDFSEIATGTLSLVNAPFAPRQVVLDTSKKVCGLNVPVAPLRMTLATSKDVCCKNSRKGSNIVFTVHSNVPDNVMGCSDRLQRALSALLGRAVDVVHGQTAINVSITSAADRHGAATADGSMQIAIQAAEENEDWRQYVSTVQDTLNNLNTPQYSSGLILETLICQHLAQRMGGRLFAECDEVCVVNFTCRFPTAPILSAGINEGLKKFQEHRVLVASTGDVDQGDISLMLKQLQMKPVVMPMDEIVALAQSGAKHDVLRASVCIIVDSPQAAQELRTWKRLQHQPLILVTGPTLKIHAREIQDIDAASFLSWPCTTVNVGIALATALKDRMRPSPFSWMGLEFGKMNVLVVDSCWVNRRLVAKMLNDCDCNVTVAESGAEALEIVIGKEFDAILLDIEMPVMGGVEAALKIRQSEYVRGTSPMPIVMIRAGVDPGLNEEDKVKLGKLGIKQELLKPAFGRRLGAALKACVAQKAHTRREARI